MEAIRKVADTWPYTVIPVNFLCCSCGFWNYINTFSYGYSLSMIANGILTLAVYHDVIKNSDRNNIQRICQAGLSVAYGVRLGEYIFRRRSKKSYSLRQSELDEVVAKGTFKKTSIIVTLVSGLMSSYILPLAYNFKYDWPEGETGVVSLLGCGLAAVGLVLQWIADEQKLSHKEAGGGCVMGGTYKYLRHPNYTGEVLFHTGMYLSGFCAYSNLKEMCLASVAPFMMNYVMIMATNGLDAKQLKKYGEDKTYKAWRERTWGLIPFIF